MENGGLIPQPRPMNWFKSISVPKGCSRLSCAATSFHLLFPYIGPKPSPKTGPKAGQSLALWPRNGLRLAPAWPWFSRRIAAILLAAISGKRSFSRSSDHQPFRLSLGLRRAVSFKKWTRNDQEWMRFRWISPSKAFKSFERWTKSMRNHAGCPVEDFLEGLRPVLSRGDVDPRPRLRVGRHASMHLEHAANPQRLA